MRITVLGKSPAWQDADGACSGYLVEGGGQVVLLDCGPGVFAKLRRFVDYVDVDAVVISHLHADHILDLVPFASGLRYAPRQQPVPVDGNSGTDHPARPRLIAPPGALEAFSPVAAAGIMPADHIELAFDVTVYDPADGDAVGRPERALPARPALHPGQRGRARRATARGSRSRPTAAQRRTGRVRGRHRPAADRGHAARPEREATAGT